MTSYKDEYRVNFPVSTQSQDILSVPKLDGIREHLLSKKYESKALPSEGKSVTLHSQPYKSIEKYAFQGQTSARYGLITTAYIQQALWSLLTNFTT